MVSSILTNNGAMTALQSLKSTQKSLLETQNRISTGLKVSTAKDNAATWAVATSMRSDIANYKQVSENLSVSSSILSTAETAATSIADLVKEVRTKVSSAQNPAVDKAQVQADIDALMAQIDSTAAAASFKGVNLVNAGGQQRILTSVNGDNGVSTAAYTNVAKQNLSIEDGSMLESLKGLTVLSRADQTLQNTNDGVRKLRLDVGAAGVTDINTGNTLTFKYVDATGTERDMTIKASKDISDLQSLVDYLNADKDFSAMFQADRINTTGATLDATGFTISAKNRDDVAYLGGITAATKVGDYTDVLTWKKGTGADGGVAQAAAATDEIMASTVRNINMTFADGPLQVGDSFELKIGGNLDRDDAANQFTYVLKVVDDASATGDLLVGDPAYSNLNNTYVIAVAASKVTGANVSGKDIAEEFKTALTTGATKVATTGEGIAGDANADFVSGAATANAFGVSVDATTGRLSISNADAASPPVAQATTFDLYSFTSSKTDYQTLLSKLDKATTNVANAAASFGTAGNRIDMQKEFLDKLVDTLSTGLGALVDADMSEEAARLQALQVQEQLGTQALSIANQAPQSILSLFGR